MVSKALGASEFAPSTAEELLQATALAGQGARTLGLTDEETLAAVTQVSDITGANMAGTRITALMDSLQKIGAGGMTITSPLGKPEKAEFDFSGDSLMQMLTEIKERNLDDANMFKLFGRKEGLKAYQTLIDDPAQYEKIRGTIIEAEKTDRVSRQLALGETDPSSEAARVFKKSEAAVSLATEDVGIARNLADAIVNDYKARVYSGEVNAPGPDRAAVWTMDKARRLGRIIGIQSDDEFLVAAERDGMILDRRLQTAVNRRRLNVSRDETRKKVFAGFEEHGVPAGAQGPLAQEFRAMQEAAGELKGAAGDMRQATVVEKSRNPTLGNPDVDR